MASMQEALDSLSDKSIRHIVSISGGKDSTALALYMRQSYPEIPAEYVFCDTGCELPETYEYLERLEALLGVEVKRLNALDDLKVARKAWSQSLRRLPERALRRFPAEPPLEVVHPGAEDPALRALRRRHPRLQLHRHPRRRGQGGVPIQEAAGDLPAAEHPAGVPLQGRGDDPGGHQADSDRVGIGIPGYYRWRSRSGCYFCFYQQVGEWQNLKDVHPDLFEKAMGYERDSVGDRGYTWVDGRPLLRIAELPEREGIPVPDLAEGCAVCHL